MAGDKTVYANLVYIKTMAEVAIEHFDEIINWQPRIAKNDNKFGLSDVLAAIRGCSLEAADLLKKGKIK